MIIMWTSYLLSYLELDFHVQSTLDIPNLFIPESGYNEPDLADWIFNNYLSWLYRTKLENFLYHIRTIFYQLMTICTYFFITNYYVIFFTDQSNFKINCSVIA